MVVITHESSSGHVVDGCNPVINNDKLIVLRHHATSDKIHYVKSGHRGTPPTPLPTPENAMLMIIYGPPSNISDPKGSF